MQQELIEAEISNFTPWGLEIGANAVPGGVGLTKIFLRVLGLTIAGNLGEALVHGCGH